MRLRSIRSASRALRDLVHSDNGGSNWGGVPPTATLLAERPPGAEAPTDYWITNLPATTPSRTLVRMAKIR